MIWAADRDSHPSAEMSTSLDDQLGQRRLDRLPSNLLSSAKDGITVHWAQLKVTATSGTLMMTSGSYSIFLRINLEGLKRIHEPLDILAGLRPNGP